MKFVLYAILSYILYQFIFKLVIPVYLASRKIKKGLKEMESRMQNQSFDQNKHYPPGYTTQSTAPKQDPKKSSDDYIEYEEVK